MINIYTHHWDIYQIQKNLQTISRRIYITVCERTINNMIYCMSMKLWNNPNTPCRFSAVKDGIIRLNAPAGDYHVLNALNIKWHFMPRHITALWMCKSGYFLLLTCTFKLHCLIYHIDCRGFQGLRRTRGWFGIFMPEILHDILAVWCGLLLCSLKPRTRKIHNNLDEMGQYMLEIVSADARTAWLTYRLMPICETSAAGSEGLHCHVDYDR